MKYHVYPCCVMDWRPVQGVLFLGGLQSPRTLEDL